MRILRVALTVLFTIAAGSGEPAHAQTLFRSWHLKMSDIQALSRIAVIRGEHQHDALGRGHVSGVLAQRAGSDRNPEQIFFDVDFKTLLLRGTEYDPDFLLTSFTAGYRRRRNLYTVDLFGAHIRRMNTDRRGRLNANFFGAAFADPEFGKRRFGKTRRLHGRIAGGAIVSENGLNASARYQVAVRYDYCEFKGGDGHATRARAALPSGQIFLEGEADVLDGPNGLMTDLEFGVRFLFLPDADNSISFAVKFYDSKNPFGHADDGIRFDIDLEGGHSGALFKYFIGNTAGELTTGFRGEDVAADLAVDFDLVRLRRRGRDYIVVLDTLQRAAWGFINKVEYNILGGIETPGTTGAAVRDADRRGARAIAGVYLDHRSTHGLDRVIPEKNYNIVRVGVKSPGWDSGREDETAGRVAAHASVGRYVENTFKKSRDWDARGGVRVDGPPYAWEEWSVIPYLKGTIRNATNETGTTEITAETGLRFNGHALFARYSQDAFFGNGGFGGLSLRF